MGIAAGRRRTPHLRFALSCAILVLLMGVLACQFVETPTRPRPTSDSPTHPRPTSGAASPAPGLQLRLAVAPVAADRPGYDRGEWRHWNDVDRDCQNARHEVLIEESTTPVTFKSDERCRVATGNWTGPYTGTESTMRPSWISTIWCPWQTPTGPAAGLGTVTARPPSPTIWSFRDT